MRRYVRKSIFVFILICFTTVFCGCWDYSEMNDFKYVAGFAVDRDRYSDEYILTLEVLEASVGSKGIKSNIVQSRGKTIHSALRDAIKKTGKMLQLSHSKVFIVSKDIASEGIVAVSDLIIRDVEVRNDMWILISNMNTASEILTKSKKSEDILSYELAESIKNANNIGQYIQIEAFKLISYISAEGITATVPMIKIVKDNENVDFAIEGTAVFKEDKMVGQLDKDETLFLMLLKENKLKFVMPIELKNNKIVGFELMDIKRKTKVKTKDKIGADIYINMDVSLSELSEREIDYVSKIQREDLKQQSEEYIEKNCYSLIEKIQKQYKSDIIGFGHELRNKNPNEWKKISSKWDLIFENMDINVFVKVNIKYSGLMNKNIKVGD